MIGSLTLRSVHYVLVIGAKDVEVVPDAPARWTVSLMFAGDGLRLDSMGVVGEDEMRAFADELDALSGGRRTKAQLATADGSLSVALERRGPIEVSVAIRLLRDRATGLYSAAETITLRSHVDEVAAQARRFPHG